MSRTAARTRPARLLAPFLLLLAVLAPATASAEPGTQVPGRAWVRVGHFVPGMGEVTIELEQDGSRIDITPAGSRSDKVGYGVASPYRRLEPGRFTARVREAGGGADATVLLSRVFEVSAGQARTMAVVGTPDAPRLVLLTDELAPPLPGTARVRLLSAARSAEAVTARAVDGPVLADGAVLGQATDYTDVPAGRWTVELDGGDESESRPVDLASGSVYTLVVLDDAAGLDLGVLTDAAGPVVMPRGSAATGGGGTAPGRAPLTAPALERTDGEPSGWLLVPVVVVLAGAVLRRRARSRA